jgi:two-component system, OmpR family, phosphate regulon sensor histidine kinase PhoR
VRARLFWNLGLTYLALILAVFLAINFYASRAVRQDYVHATSSQLLSISNVAAGRPPRFADAESLRSWTDWLAGSGAGVAVIDAAGHVLSRSSGASIGQPGSASDSPEIKAAFSSGQGESIRRDEILRRDIAFRAVRYRLQGASPVVVQLALPLAEVDTSLADLRRRLLGATIVILAAGAIALFFFFRSFAERVERLKRFSLRLAQGDFRHLPAERFNDELGELTKAMNETATWMDRTIRSLSGERNRSGAILRSMVEGVGVIDAQERLVFSNQAFSDILNRDSASSEGRPLIEVIRNTELLGLIRRALGGEEGLQSDIVMGTVQQRSFSVTAAPVKALEAGAVSDRAFPARAGLPAEEKPSGAIVVLHDVTELRRLERVRQDFVANVSHEFKTPLTAIQGFAETLLAGAIEDPTSNRRFLEIIRDHAIRLARLTDDLLKLARIEAGKLEVQFFPVVVIDLVERCAETALLKAHRKQIALEINVPQELPPMRGDAGLLRDVLQNLLDNAIQYTPSGGRIHVSAATRDHEVVLTVADTGIGIPLADQERIFERFYRVDAARSREAGGTGLGLSIAKHIVEVHGGRLLVESEVGLGSKFSFSIPLAV